MSGVLLLPSDEDKRQAAIALALLDRDAFAERLPLWALRVPKTICDPLLRLLRSPGGGRGKLQAAAAAAAQAHAQAQAGGEAPEEAEPGWIFEKPKLRAFVPEPSDPEGPFRLLLLDERRFPAGEGDGPSAGLASCPEAASRLIVDAYRASASPAAAAVAARFPPLEAASASESPSASALLASIPTGLLLARHSVEVPYEHFPADAVLRRLLPAHVREIPGAFETIGHVAHVNLREEHLPFKALIGRVLLDKNPKLRTVVNKVGVITSEFRVPDLELVAGEASTETEVRQHGAVFR